jgi:hypothetical protein
MALITVSELKAVLGIGNIYADAIVQDVVDAAENVLLSYLIFDDVAIQSVKLKDNVATFYCFENTFVTGQALTVTGCGSPFDGSRTVLESGYGASFDGLPSILDTRYNNYQIPFFTAAITNADISERKIIPVGRAVLTSQATLYDSGYPEISRGVFGNCVRHLDHSHRHTWPAGCGLSKPCPVSLRSLNAHPGIWPIRQAPRH